MGKYTLVGVNGNAFCIMGYVSNAMKECGKTKEEIKEYTDNAMSDDYEHLLAISVDKVEELNKENPSEEDIEENV